MLRTKGSWFIDENDRVVFLRGVNLGGSTKVPAQPDGSTYRSEGFFNHREVSFTGRPFPLEEADEHFTRLRSWGFNCLRFLITWEAVEHSGPGIFDEDYLNYLFKIVKRAGEYGFYVFIDPHQDVWSRFSGGDGAPGWTLEAAGFDLTSFKETGAAIVHQTHGDPFPRMIWPTNAYKLAAATMFTLFFAGNDFAPKTKVDGIPIQDYLQNHYLGSIRKVAQKLKGLDCVIGYDIFNELQHGYVEVMDLSKPYGELDFGVCPTPWQSILLGSGFPQYVSQYSMGAFGSVRGQKTWINRGGRSAWLPGRTCVWRENGVWDIHEHPVLLKPNYFSNVGGRGVDFLSDYLVPFIDRFEQSIHMITPDSLIFLESDIYKQAPVIPDAAKRKMVYAPHFYDGATLFLKKYFSWLAHDNRTGRIILGKKKRQASLTGQLNDVGTQYRSRLGDIPVIIGEVGIPFDLDNKKAYSTGNFSNQRNAMEDSIQALESNLLNYTLWNYTSDNTNARGDHWNDEDLSIFSRDQQFDLSDINSGGRALDAVVRPFPLKTSGIPISVKFDFRNGAFHYSYKTLEINSHVTEIFIPRIQYPFGIKVEVSDGSHNFDKKTGILSYFAGDLKTHDIRVFRI
jgi:hypothetical protein